MLRAPAYETWSPDMLVDVASFVRERSGHLEAQALLRRMMPLSTGLGAQPRIEAAGSPADVEVSVSHVFGVSPEGDLCAVDAEHPVRGHFELHRGPRLLGLQASTGSQSMRPFRLTCPAGEGDLVVGRLLVGDGVQVDRAYRAPVQTLGATDASRAWCQAADAAVGQLDDLLHHTLVEGARRDETSIRMAGTHTDLRAFLDEAGHLRRRIGDLRGPMATWLAAPPAVVFHEIQCFLRAFLRSVEHLALRYGATPSDHGARFLQVLHQEPRDALDAVVNRPYHHGEQDEALTSLLEACRTATRLFERLTPYGSDRALPQDEVFHQPTEMVLRRLPTGPAVRRENAFVIDDIRCPAEVHVIQVLLLGLGTEALSALGTATLLRSRRPDDIGPEQRIQREFPGYSGVANIGLNLAAGTRLECLSLRLPARLASQVSEVRVYGGPFPRPATGSLR